MSKKQRGKIDLNAQDSGFGQNPFAQLSHLKDALPSLEVTPEEAPQEAPPETVPAHALLTASKRITLRRDDKRRGGKTVTFIEGIRDVSQERLEELARSIAKKLGCRAQLEDEHTIMVQGDQRERLPDLLRSYGAQDIHTR